MKKAYSKPEIMFEDFSPSVNVAAGCEFKTSTATAGVCGYPTRNDGIIFVTGVSGCVHTEPDINDSLCYHVPNEYHNIFNS
jgi:hypothetical protein